MTTLPPTARLRRRKQRVPDLVGLLEPDATLVLKHRGFYDTRLIGTPDEGNPRVDVRYTKHSAPFETVVGQEPGKGQIIDSDAAITLTVSMESLSDFLPALFRRKDTAGENFINEFLWIFQHIFRSIETKIGQLYSYFDVFETPSEFLPWLASWVAFALDGNWSESDRRLFLKKAVELYKIRGTVRGLSQFITMYTGVEPNIIENDWPLDGFQIGVASTIGIDSAILPRISRAHCFIVEVPLDSDDLEDDEIIKIHQIISHEKPAHTTYYLRFTGEQERMTTWTGPVIGAYRVGSTAEVGRAEPEVEEETEVKEDVVKTRRRRRRAKDAASEETAKSSGRRRRRAKTEEEEDEEKSKLSAKDRLRARAKARAKAKRKAEGSAEEAEKPKTVKKEAKKAKPVGKRAEKKMSARDRLRARLKAKTEKLETASADAPKEQKKDDKKMTARERLRARAKAKAKAKKDKTGE
jgi:phage tail-like protein